MRSDGDPCYNECRTCTRRLWTVEHLLWLIVHYSILCLLQMMYIVAHEQTDTAVIDKPISGESSSHADAPEPFPTARPLKIASNPPPHAPLLWDPGSTSP